MATETTPLFNGRTSAHASDDTDSTFAGVNHAEHGIREPDKTPFPITQVLLLCYARLTEPIAFFCIFPFIAQMVKANGRLDDSDVGFYSGIIESLFSITQMVVLLFWGRLADKIGRKPVLLYSMLGMAVGSTLFGFSTSILQMVVFRCLAGVFSGSSLILRTMVAEISTKETEATMFSWFAFSGNLGIFLGPLIGGVLADPTQQYPGLFGGLDFLKKYPYALSCLVTGSLSLTGALTSALFLNETLKKESVDESSSTATNAQQTNQSIWQLLRAPGVAIVLWVNTHCMLLAFAFTAILPVALFTPVSLGGASMSSLEISVFLAIQGGSQALWILIGFPVLQRRMGTRRLLKVCGDAYPFLFLSYIVLNTLLRYGGHIACVWFWILGTVVVTIFPGVAMMFTGTQLVINNISPDTQTLGTLNALALTICSGIRAFVPAVGTAIYAIGVRSQILGGHLAWVILTAAAIAFAVCVRCLPGDNPKKVPT
ncbi:hypothetical protein QWA68_015257 [Fusarium oxysporum]|nr:hypothetical protein QWA68_015257 [Fusarium oxysporum]